MHSPSATPTASRAETGEAQAIFTDVWNDLVRERGEDSLAFPREMLWLNGAPGAGKGTLTCYLMHYCGLNAPPVVISDLLANPEARALMDAGQLVGDREVIGLLLRALLEPERAEGVIIDGFPRTMVQVECLKCFHARLRDLHQQHRAGPLAARFPAPRFRVVVLHIDEELAVYRQLLRGRRTLAHNEEVRRTGQGSLRELRKTDTDPEVARARYRTFLEITYHPLTSLNGVFPYDLFDGEGTPEKVGEDIRRRFAGEA
jgi:adenylate kinase